MASAIDMKGLRSGKLVVLEEAGRSSSGAITWLCQCDCGQTKVVIGTKLRSQRAKSCGCIAKSLTRTVKCWRKRPDRSRDEIVPMTFLGRTVYRVMLMVDGEMKSIGRFSNRYEAYRARNDAARKQWGSEASLLEMPRETNTWTRSF